MTLNELVEELKEWVSAWTSTTGETDFATALEGQLKIGEMLRLPTIGFEIEEYAFCKHLLEKNLLTQLPKNI